MTRFRSSDFGFRIWAAYELFSIGAVLLAQAPARTPTPAPRLSGGFGRPRATPVATPASDAGGQSLSDVVHAARESREGQPPEKSGVTIDNRSLVKGAEKGRVSTSKPVPSHARPVAPASTPVPSAPAAAAGAASDGSATGGTEAEWRQRAAQARKRVADDKSRVAELDAATKKLENDFYAWDDGQYRDRVIKPAWDRSRSDLETAKEQLAEAEKDLADLPESARKAGALPGWIRE